MDVQGADVKSEKETEDINEECVNEVARQDEGGLSPRTLTPFIDVPDIDTKDETQDEYIYEEHETKVTRQADGGFLAGTLPSFLGGARAEEVYEVLIALTYIVRNNPNSRNKRKKRMHRQAIAYRNDIIRSQLVDFEATIEILLVAIEAS